MTKSAFIELVTADQPEAPAYFTYDAVLNSRERQTLDRGARARDEADGARRVLAGRDAGAQILDTRDAAEFASAHIAGSINVGLGGPVRHLGGHACSIRSKPIVIVAIPGAEAESAMRLGRIGFDQVVGFLEGGMAAAQHRPDVVVATDRLSPEVAAARLSGANSLLAIDVRAPGERRDKRIEPSMACSLSSLRDPGPEIPRDRPLLVYCAGGYRSSIGASLLERAGFTNVSQLAGGLAAWENAGQPVATG